MFLTFFFILCVDYGGPPMSAERCFWPDDDGQLTSSKQSNRSGGGSYSTNNGLLAVAPSSVSSKSSSLSITAPAKTTLVESVLHTAASMLASLVLGVDVRMACNSSR